MEEKANEIRNEEEKKENTLSETWAQDALEDLEDFIESQGIYIRQ
ncbi:MAG: hypothetical protein SOZ59_05795 [Candidatus Limivivens sp.]|nr:hypothetical protein [Candidatus Limivivens sp.]